ncbi:hypothetical protein RV18_GL000096 [Enterococcus termitis]|nr:hypothetical protein RV18_GL000096 [Enterococcus termitis]
MFMKRFVKVILALITLLLFIGTLGLFSQVFQIPWLSLAVSKFLISHLWLFSFFEWILLILGGLLLITLVIVLSVSGRRNRLVVKEGQNKIEIPKSTVAQIAENAYNSTIHPDKTKLTVKIKGKEKVLVKLKIEVRSKTRFAPMADEIKQRVEEALANALESIDSKVVVSLKEKEPTESAAFGKKHSRVV